MSQRSTTQQAAQSRPFLTISCMHTWAIAGERGDNMLDRVMQGLLETPALANTSLLNMQNSHRFFKTCYKFKSVKKSHLKCKPLRPEHVYILFYICLEESWFLISRMVCRKKIRNGIDWKSVKVEVNTRENVNEYSILCCVKKSKSTSSSFYHTWDTFSNCVGYLPGRQGYIKQREEIIYILIPLREFVLEDSLTRVILFFLFFPNQITAGYLPVRACWLDTSFLIIAKKTFLLAKYNNVLVRLTFAKNTFL